MVNGQKRAGFLHSTFNTQHLTLNTLEKAPSGRLLSEFNPAIPLGLSVEYFSSSSWNVQKATMTPHVLSQFNNSSLALLYEASESIKLGGELKQETFFQKYRGTDLNGLNVIYEQQPNFTTFTGLVRLTSNGWVRVKPFIQANAGWNKVGYVFRAVTGVSYCPYYDVSFNLGVELSDLLYFYQSKGFNSTKFSINYGFGYSF